MNAIFSLFLISVFVSSGCGIHPRQKGEPPSTDKVKHYRFDELLIDKDLNLKADTTIEVKSLVFGHGAQIITNGFRLYIISDFIEFNENLFLTFPDDNLLSDKAGKDGGEISLQAERATGVLEVVMRGQNGSKGADGAEFQQRANSGARGTDGKWALLKVVGKGVRFCSKKPSYGSNGVDGLNGKSGQNGFSGGDGGHLIVNIPYKQDMVLNAHGAAGKGGAGGVGSQGQLGGPPGKTGVVPNECKKMILGRIPKEGVQGLKGDDGEMGTDGEPPVFSIF